MRYPWSLDNNWSRECKVKCTVAIVMLDSIVASLYVCSPAHPRVYIIFLTFQHAILKNWPVGLCMPGDELEGS
jgi:hypothetical protein